MNGKRNYPEEKFMGTTKTIDSIATKKNIRRLLNERSLTPRDIQELLGYQSVQTIYKWLNTDIKTLPSLDNIFRLSGLLGCTIDDILVTTEK